LLERTNKRLPDYSALTIGLVTFGTTYYLFGTAFYRFGTVIGMLQ